MDPLGGRRVADPESWSLDDVRQMSKEDMWELDQGHHAFMGDAGPGGLEEEAFQVHQRKGRDLQGAGGSRSPQGGMRSLCPG